MRSIDLVIRGRFPWQRIDAPLFRPFTSTPADPTHPRTPGENKDIPAVTREDATTVHPAGRGMLFFAMNPWVRAVVMVGGGLLACVSSQGAPAPDYLDDNFLYEMRSLLDTPEAWRVSGPCVDDWIKLCMFEWMNGRHVQK